MGSGCRRLCGQSRGCWRSPPNHSPQSPRWELGQEGGFHSWREMGKAAADSDIHDCTHCEAWAWGRKGHPDAALCPELSQPLVTTVTWVSCCTCVQGGHMVTRDKLLDWGEGRGKSENSLLSREPWTQNSKNHLQETHAEENRWHDYQWEEVFAPGEIRTTDL